jgi:predicted metal-binding protein
MPANPSNANPTGTDYLSKAAQSLCEESFKRSRFPDHTKERLQQCEKVLTEVLAGNHLPDEYVHSDLKP